MKQPLIIRVDVTLEEWRRLLERAIDTALTELTSDQRKEVAAAVRRA